MYSGLNSFLTANDPAPPAGYPKAYLNWIFLDDQFNYVSSSSGSVKAASTTSPSATLNAVAPGSPISITKNGYLYIWVSNETQGWDVFFDNLSVQHRPGPLLEENHYYPFGLTMAGISDKAIKTNYAENKYRCNGGDELQNKEFSDGSGLELYDAVLRMYDPQIGRFGQIDPLGEVSEYLSPYSFVADNPISFNDPLGLTDSVKSLPPVIVYGYKPKPPPPPSVNVGPPPSAPTDGAAVPLPIGPNLYPIPGGQFPGSEPVEIPAPAIGAAALGLTIVGVLIPAGGPRFPNNDEGYIYKHPELTPGYDPYPGHGNNKNNSNPHIVYAFGFAPTDGKTPILKYGISDEFRFGMDRPEGQLGALKAKYGPTVMYSIYTRTVNRAQALLIEADLVRQHRDMWNGALPREQLRPNP